MKFIKLSSFLAIATAITFIYLSCDDAGIINNNNMSFTFKNLQNLDTSVDGIYEAWIYFPLNGYISIGKFNISISGQPVDPSGQPITFKLKYQVPDINGALGGLVTIVPPGGGVDTFGTKFLAGPKTSNNNYLVFNVSMESDTILGSAATQMPYDTARYILYNPTDSISRIGYKGIWFTKDTNGNEASLTLSNIPPNRSWIYQAWVMDNSSRKIYNVGRFSSPNGNDDYNNCQGPNPGFNKPGNDWIEPDCPPGMPQITNLNNGNYSVFITLEPKYRAAETNPFFIRLFSGNISVSAPGVMATIPNVTILPTATIQISKN